MRGTVRGVVSSACAIGFCLAAAAHAHEARPLVVEVRIDAEDLVAVRTTAPPSVDEANYPRLVLPIRCLPIDRADASGGSMALVLYRCPGGLAGETLSIRYPRFNPSLTTLIRLRRPGGFEQVAVLPPDERTYRIPQTRRLEGVAWDYLWLGLRHILGGFDHLMFVCGLVLLARTWRRVAVTLTGFTIAHSITLGLAALDHVTVPLAVVEVLIALSILTLACELARPMTDTFTKRRPVAAASAFGLLHGMGFAGGLLKSGLPHAHVAAALLTFNLGVEIGQLALVLVLLAAAALARRTSSAVIAGPGFVRLRAASVFALGALAAFWTLERTAALVA